MKIILIRLVSFCGQIMYPFYIFLNWLRTPRDILYSQVVKYSFKAPIPSFVSFTPPLHLVNSKYVQLGERVRISEYSTISVWKRSSSAPSIIIGDNVKIGAFAHVTACNRIVIEDNVLIGKFVTISDNSHGRNDYSDIVKPPTKRPLYSKGGVIIKNHVWIGDKVTILSGVCVGEYSIIGANTVVTKDVPPYSIVCGNPGRVVKNIIKKSDEKS